MEDPSTRRTGEVEEPIKSIEMVKIEKKLIFVMKLINNSNHCLPENVVEIKIKLIIKYRYVKSVSAIKVCLSSYPSSSFD